MLMFKLPCLALLLMGQLNCVVSYKPVIIIHGILDGAAELSDLKDFIQMTHNGTKVDLIDLFDYYQSFTPLWRQVDAIRDVISELMKSAKDGVNIIGYSQGGLVARGLIQTTHDHNVDTFIGLSSPLNGQYGDTSWLKWLLPRQVKADLYKFFYSTLGQKWSIGNYWKDPHKMDMYKEYSEYLARLNNESNRKDGDHVFQPSWKKNFARLKKVVLVGGPNDGVITPWQSALFGTYDENENVVEMKDQKIYKDDVFGLLSLDQNRALETCVVPNITHLMWHKDVRVFNKCIAKYLQ